MTDGRFSPEQLDIALVQGEVLNVDPGDTRAILGRIGQQAVRDARTYDAVIHYLDVHGDPDATAAQMRVALEELRATTHHKSIDF